MVEPSDACVGAVATIQGTPGDDVLVGTDGDDIIVGGDGDDVIVGGLGDDLLCGGDGADDISGNEGNDTISGGDGDDVLGGGMGDDVILGQAGDDTIRGRRGADSLFGGPGDDYITGNGQDDVIVGGPGSDDIGGGMDNDLLLGGDGDDLIDGKRGADMIFGQAGNDNLRGRQGSDVIAGGEGDDFIRGGKADDQLFGQGGDDTIRGRAGNDFLDGGDDVDSLDGDGGTDVCDDGETNVQCETITSNGDPDEDPVLCDDLEATIVGTEGDDILTGTSGDDVIAGLGGDDTIDGLDGDDLICGGDGDDVIDGGTGNDVVDGGDGADSVLGGVGDDLVDGGPGNDSVHGGDGMDLVEGSAGDDVLTGGLGDDTMAGDLGDDSLDGGQGADLLDGGDGTDSLVGGEGNDRLRGGPGPDTIVGDAGDDVIKGGDGDDTVTAGAGDDVVDAGDGTDAVDGGDGTDICESAETSVSCESDVIPEADPFPLAVIADVMAPAQVVSGSSRASFPGLNVVIDSAGGITDEDISIEPAVVPIGGPISRVAVGPIVDITIPETAAAFNSATITLPYDEALLPVGFDEANVEVLTFDEDVDLWFPVTANEVVNQVDNTITVSVDHFSLYTVAALGPGGIEEVFGLDAFTAPVCSAGPQLTYGETILADGAIAYWPLGDATDAGPNGLDLTAVDGTTGPPVEFGQLEVINESLDGSVRPNDGHLLTGTLGVGSPLLAPNFTVETWVNDAIVDLGPQIYGLTNGAGAPVGGLQVQLFAGDTSTNSVIVEATFTTGTVSLSAALIGDLISSFHLVITATGGTVRIFINGVERAVGSTTSGDLAYTAATSYVARLAEGQQNPFLPNRALRYDEFALYDRALTAAEVLVHSNLGNGGGGGGEETGGGASPTLDSDTDGLTDCEEVEGVIVPSKLTKAFDYEFVPNYPFGDPPQPDAYLVQTLPNDADSDNDGLEDGTELIRVSLTSKPLLQSVYPVLWDSGIEFLFVANSDPNDPDTEGDGLNDGLEAAAGTKPYLQDTDGDGLGDFAEVLDGDPSTDPLVPNGNEFGILGLPAKTLFQPFELPLDGGGVFTGLAFERRIRFVDDTVLVDIFAPDPVGYNYSGFAQDYACIDNCVEIDAWATQRVLDGAGCLPFGIPLGCQDEFEVTSRKIAEIVDAQRIWEPETDVLSPEFIAEAVANRCLYYSADTDTCGDLNDPDLIRTIDAQDPDDFTRYVNFVRATGTVTETRLEGRPIDIKPPLALALALLLLNSDDPDIQAKLLTSEEATAQQVAAAIRQCSLTPDLFATVATVLGGGGWIRNLHPCLGLNIYVVGRDVDINTTVGPDNSDIRATQIAPDGNAKDPVAHRIAAIVATPSFALEQYRTNPERLADGVTPRDWYIQVSKALDDARCVNRTYETTLYQCDEFPNFSMSKSGSTFFNNGTTRPLGLDGAALSILSEELNRREGNRYRSFTLVCEGVRREPPAPREHFLVVPVPGDNAAPPSMAICRPSLLGG